MNEAVRALGAKEVSDLIGEHITAFLDGGPDRETEDIELAQKAGLKVERTIARWADAREYLLHTPPASKAAPLTGEKAEPLPPAQEAKAASADSAKAEVVKGADDDSATSWKRRNWGEEEERPAASLRAELVKKVLAKKKAEASFFVPDAQPIAVDPKVTTVPASSLLDRPFNEIRPPYSSGPIPEAPIAPPNTGIDRLTYPRGLLGHVTQYMVDTSPLPNRWLALAAALCVLAKGLDRKVIGPSGTSTVLYILLMAETGAGKQQALQSIRMVLKAMGLGNVIVAGGLASVQAIEEIVEETPSAMVVIDEVGAWLNRISAGGQTGNVAEIPGTLQSLWAWSPEDEWIGTKRKGKEMVTVFGPALSIFGDSTEAKLIKGLTKEEIANGFLNRWLLFGIGRGAPKRVDPKYDWTKFPTWLSKQVKAVVGDPVPHKGLVKLTLPANDGSEIVVQDFRRISWGSGAKELWAKFEEYTRGMPSEKDRELWIRAPEQAVRLATIVAVYRGSAIVEVEDWQWAVEVVKYSMAQLVRSLGKHRREKLEQADLVERIREEFLRTDNLPKDRPVAGELTHGQINKLCETLCEDYRKIDIAIRHLLSTGEIEEFFPTKPGPKTNHYRWRQRH
jgi:hypothetical protein